MAAKSLSQRALRLFAINQSPSTCNRLKQYPSSTTFRFMSGSSDVDNPSHHHKSSDVDNPSHHHKSRLPCDFISTLQKRYPNLAISTNSYDLDSHGHGESHHPVQPPDAVIRPTSVEEIQDILFLCCRERKAEGKDNDDNLSTVEVVSVIPYGAGTSVEGHLNFLFPTDDDDDNDDDNDDRDTNEEGKLVEIPSTCFANHNDDSRAKSYKKVRVQRKGGISIDMCNFDAIGEVGSDGFVQVGAGVTRNTLNEALRHTGMMFMVDPGADATIGGMTSTGASGTSAVKYGTMRENVLAMNAILPPTSISSVCDEDTNDTTKPHTVHLGCNALKSSAGYNLPALLTGSEGTLGVITDVKVKIHPVPAYTIAASCAFDDLHSAAEAVAMIKMMGIPISRIELLDEQSIQAFNKTLCDDDIIKPMKVKPHLFLEFASHSEPSVMEDLTAAQNICVGEFQATNFESASDESTRQSLWAARHRLYYSSIALRPGNSDDNDDEGATPQSTILTDVCVPLSSFADIISATAQDVKELGVIGPCFGHAGDGNYHCILPLKKNDTKDYRDNVQKIIENLTDRAIEVGGTCTGEHGVGYGKKKYLRRMYGEGGVKMMESLKQSIDPFNIMNPGKIVDNDFYGR